MLILPKFIKSGSENVKKIFAENAENRTIEFLSTLKLSNAEILETCELSFKEGSRSHWDATFYKKLFESQKGPFNEAVVNLFMDNLIYVGWYKKLIPLLMKSDKNIPEKAKCEWLLRVQRFSPDEVEEFVDSGAAAKLGFNIYKKPWQTTFMLNMINRQSFSEKRAKLLYDHFDTMTEDELIDFYLKSQNVNDTLPNEHIKFTIWSNYPKIPGRIIMEYFKKIGYYDEEEVMKMIKNPNCPLEIKIQVYKETGDASLLPEEVRDIFCFGPIHVERVPKTRGVTIVI